MGIAKNSHLKKVVLVITFSLQLLLIGCVSLQTISLESPVVEVFEGLDGDSNQIFVKANEWMIKTFSDAESVIQFSDKEEGTLIGKYLMGGGVSSSQYGTYDTRVYAIIDIRVKDSKARISIDPQQWQSYNSDLYPGHAYTKEKVERACQALIKDFHTHLLGSNVDF